MRRALEAGEGADPKKLRKEMYSMMHEELCKMGRDWPGN